MFVWVAMTVVMVGWDYQGTEPPAVIAISLRVSEFYKTCAGIVDDIGDGGGPRYLKGLGRSVGKRR